MNTMNTMNTDIIQWIILAFIAFGFIRAFYRIMLVKQYGVEAMARVSRIETKDVTDADGVPSTYYDYFVRYRTEDGREMEAALSNPDNRLTLDDWLSIKYLPDSPESVVMVKRG